MVGHQYGLNFKKALTEFLYYDIRNTDGIRAISQSEVV